MKEAPDKSVNPERSLRQQLLRGGAAGVFVRIGSIGAALIGSITLARILGPDSYGIYAFVFSVIGLLGLPVQMGLPNLVLRETARADQAQDGALMVGIRRWPDIVMVLMSGVIFTCAAVYFWLTQDVDTPRHNALLWATPLVLLIGFVETRGAVLRGLRHLILGVSPYQIIRPLLLAASVLTFTLWSEAELTAARVFQMQCGVTIVVILLLGIFIRKVLPNHPNMDAPRFKTKAWLLALLPLSAISGLHAISQNTDIIMLGYLATDADVGLYRVTLSSANFVVFGLTAAGLVLAPHFARASAAGNVGQLQKLATLGARASFAIAILICTTFFLLGDWILATVYGSAYGAAYSALVLLSIGQAINAFFGSVISLLTMTGREWVAMFGLLISTIANVVLNWLLIPLYGIEGAAIATGISVVIWNICLWLACWKIVGIDSSPFGFTPPRSIPN